MAKRLFAAILFSLVLTSAFAQTKGHNLTFKVKGIKDNYVRLAFYLGDKQYVEDSAKADANGMVNFKGDAALEPGIYILAYTKTNKYFELLVNENEQDFTLETDTVEPIKHMKIKNSNDNRLFYEYLNFVNGKQDLVKPYQEKYKKFIKEGPKDSAEVYRKKLSQIDKEVKEYKMRIMATEPKSFLATIFNASWEPEVPENPNPKDSTFAYRYYKAHFWEKFPFADKRVIRTPVLQSKIRQYLDKLTPQTPDSINVSVSVVGDKSEANKDVFHFVVNYMTNYYETSKTMGFDAVFVHLAKRYYLTGKADWIDSTQRANIKERVIIWEPILIGKPALELMLPDTTGKEIKLSTVKGDFTILFFWDPTCGHCKKEAPKLVDLYKRAKSLGVEVYAIASGGTMEDWKKEIRTFGMKWINVYDELGYRKYYDVQTTPMIYLLDKGKIIRAKKLDSPQLNDFLVKQYKLKIPPSTLPKTKDDDEHEGH
jgi:peroxiredoxin